MYHPKNLCQEKSSALKREGVRLRTFNRMWSKNFIDTKKLVKPGFSVGNSDQAQCVFFVQVWLETGKSSTYLYMNTKDTFKHVLLFK